MSFSNFNIIEGYDVRKYVQSEFQRGDKRFVMSRSQLTRFAKNPRKWLASGAREEETSSTEFGSLVDCMALEPESFKARYSICPAEYDSEMMRCPKCESVTESQKCSKCKCDREKIIVKKKWNKGATVCDEWFFKEESTGKTVVTNSVYQSAQVAVEKLNSFEEVKELIGCSKKQVYISADWECKRTGVVVPVKALLDLVPDSRHTLYGSTIADLKTSRCADGWDRTVFEHEYHVQAAFFMDMFNDATKQERTGFLHVVIENEAPYEVLTPIPFLSVEFLELGRTTYRNALSYYAHCLWSNKFPGYMPRKEMFGFQCMEPSAYMIDKETQGHWIAPSEETTEEQSNERIDIRN